MGVEALFNTKFVPPLGGGMEETMGLDNNQINNYIVVILDVHFMER